MPPNGPHPIFRSRYRNRPAAAAGTLALAGFMSVAASGGDPIEKIIHSTREAGASGRTRQRRRFCNCAVAARSPSACFVAFMDSTAPASVAIPSLAGCRQRCLHECLGNTYLQVGHMDLSLITSFLSIKGLISRPCVPDDRID